MASYTVEEIFNGNKYSVMSEVVKEILLSGPYESPEDEQTGADVKTVSSMLGHYSAGFTLDTYTHVTNHMQLQAADKMGSFMDTALPKTAPTPPEPPESGCKVIPFEMVG